MVETLLELDLRGFVEEAKREVARLRRYPGQLGQLPSSVVEPAVDVLRGAARRIVDRLVKAIGDGEVTAPDAERRLEQSLEAIRFHVVSYSDHLGHNGVAWQDCLDETKVAKKRLAAGLEALRTAMMREEFVAMRGRKRGEAVSAPEVSPQKGIELLRRQLGMAGKLLDEDPVSSYGHSRWELVTRECLAKAFGANSPQIDAVLDVGKTGVFQVGQPEAYWEQIRRDTLLSQVSQLNGLIEVLSLNGELQSNGSGASRPVAGHRIFLVHGHDLGVRESVARFLEKLDQEVIVLHEQPNQGRTIIEKFEEYADVGFAVVLLTADDRGGKAGDGYAEQRPRARQNVILELGYFLGRLGRKHVCALYQSGVEIPSDYHGVLFTPLGEREDWKLKLAMELKAAGLPVDMNKVVGA